MLSFSQLVLRRGARVLLQDATFSIYAGQRVGIVGRNGTGKTSLFELILGQLAPDRGDFTQPRDQVVAHVRQETPALPQPALDYVLDGDAEFRQVSQTLAQAESRNDTARLPALHDRMHAIDGYQAERRAAQLLHGLGFSGADQQRAVADFSGGWRMRLNLGQALMCRSDLLLLDEPTNHLDFDAVVWLQGWLARYPGTALIISHDRDFLDAVTSHTLHLERQTATLYRGNYSSSEEQRAARMAQQQATYQAQQRRAAEMQAFIDRFRAKATKARQAQSRIKQLERMERVEPAHWDAPFSFAFAEPERLPAPLLVLDNISVGHGDTVLLQGIHASLAPGDRIGLLGRNGVGKTTLMRVLAGLSEPLAGRQMRDKYLQVGYFAQHQVDSLNAQLSPIGHLRELDEQAPEQALRDFLGGFDFQGERVFEPVAPFSGGEKARLALALIVYQQPNLLLLDEPTNHLDLEMRHALERALQGFAGAVVLVAHDRHLLASTADTLWLASDGRCDSFDGDLDDYAEWIRGRQGGTAAASASPPARAVRSSGKQQRQEAAARRAEQKPLRDALKRQEKELDRINRRLGEIDARLAEPAIYQDEPQAAAELAREQGELRARLEQLETDWLETTEALEQA